MATQTVALPLVKGERYRMTFDEFMEFVPSWVHAEWVDGEVYVLIATDERHARILGFLYALLYAYLERFDLGEVFFPTYATYLRPGRSWREPDIFVVLAEHRDRVTNKGVQGPPDVIIEAVSPDDPKRDLVEKFDDYDKAGVPEYLAVDGREDHEELYFWARVDGRLQRVEPDAQGRYHSRVLPGFWIDPRWLWQNPLPKVATVLELILQRRSSTDESDS
jgi:Uma2 family endonuclease